MKSYSELVRLPTFEERLEYLKLSGKIGDETFGGRRWLNQCFYHSYEWRQFRKRIIIRDMGNDLGIDGYPIDSKVIIHHINPISYQDLVNCSPAVFDPENVICTTLPTHNAIHYRNDAFAPLLPAIRTANDTCPWKKQV